MKNDKSINLNAKVLRFYLMKYTKYWKVYMEIKWRRNENTGEKGGPTKNSPGCSTSQAHQHSKIAASVHNSIPVEKPQGPLCKYKHFNHLKLFC